MVRLLTEKDLQKIDRANIVHFILDGIKTLEQDIQLNRLREDISLSWAREGRKIHLYNLLLLLEILVKECRRDPLTGKILLEAESLLPLLQRMQQALQSGSTGLLLGKTEPAAINARLQLIVRHLEEWKTLMRSKFRLPPGNAHTRDTYHPGFPSTFSYKLDYLPDDYRSNFFFEVHIKELCPLTTTLLFHPYTEVQFGYQETRSLAQLTRINLNVDLRVPEAIEYSDNIRAFRLHGPHDSKKYPGSYIIIRGGHHRTRAIFKKYLEGKVSGKIKILMQLVEPKDFPDKNLLSWALPEIECRERLREKI